MYFDLCPIVPKTEYFVLDFLSKSAYCRRMTTSHKLARNTLYLTASYVGQKAIAFIYFTVLARFVGVEDTGAYFLALAFVMIITAINDVGMTSVVIREVAKEKDEAVLWTRTVLGIKLITMPITLVLAFFVPVLLGYDTEVITLIRISTVIMLADTLSLSFYGTLRGLHNLKYESVGIFIGQIISAVIGFVFMATGIATLPLLVIALIIGSTWNVLFSAYNIVKNLGIKTLLPTYSMGWRPLKMAFAFFLAAIFVKIYSYVDSLVLAQVIGNSAVGIYAVAYKLTYAFQFLPLAFVAALYPTMSAQANDSIKLKKTFLQAIWYLALLGMPIIFGLWALAPEIIHLFYGEEFLESVLPLQILIFVLIPIFFDFPIGSLLNATNRQHIKTGIMGVAMVINVIANVLLIPKIGVIGASISGLISFTFLFIAGWFFIRKVVSVTLRELFQQVGALIFSAICMAFVVIFLKSYMYFIFTIPIGAIVYIGIAFTLRTLTIKHIQSIIALFRNRSYENDIVTNA